MKKNLKRVIYTSSYDRGLEHLLKMWPDVVKEVPGAELHIFYGWQLFVQFHKGNPGSMMWKAEMDKMMKYKGITHHGRVSQDELVGEYEKSGIWAYPTHFGEINCISALKAQRYGCEPVVVDYAALKETVQFGRKIEGDIYDTKTQEEFKKQLIDALKNPMDKQERRKMRTWAGRYTWDKVAKTWDSLFKEAIT